MILQIFFFKLIYLTQEKFLIIIKVEHNFAALYLCGNCDKLYFSGFYDQYKM